MSISRRQQLVAAFCGVEALALLGVGVALLYRGSTPQQDPLITAAPVTIVPKPAGRSQPATVPVQITSERFVDPALPADTKDIQITAGFECSCPDVKVTKLTPSHYAVESTQQVATGGFGFMLRLDGVAGRTVRIDLNGSPFDKWGNLSVQYGTVDDLNHLAGFASAATQPTAQQDSEYRAQPRTGDKPALPDTNGQQWHYISNVWREEGRLCLQQKFDRNTVYLSHRVPYTPEYNEAYLASLQGNPNVSVIDVGKSKEGRPLRILKFAGAAAKAGMRKPGILIYAREHADEQDSSWVAQGVVQYLISAEAEAATDRARADVLVIPLIDPDGAIATKHENMISTFDVGAESPESLAFASWLAGWIDSGHSLDLVVALHNPVPGAAFHVACPMMDPDSSRFSESTKLHDDIRGLLMSAGYQVRLTPWTRGTIDRRLSSWLTTNFSTLALPYEVNSLTPKRQLKLSELRNIGGLIVHGSISFLTSPDAGPLLKEVDNTLERRNAGKRQGPVRGNVFRAEYKYRLANGLQYGQSTADHSRVVDGDGGGEHAVTP